MLGDFASQIAIMMYGLFIYENPEHYWKLEKTKDVIEWQLDETLDINGWDLQKALRLLHRSNATLFEWPSSPLYIVLVIYGKKSVHR